MKIALATWAPFLAGAEVAAERIALGLVDAGHDVLVLVGTEGEALTRYCDAGLRCECVPMATSDKWTFWKTVRMQRRLREVFLRERPDVVHANDLPTSQMVGGVARRMGLPLVCHHRWVFEQEATDWLNKYGADRHLFVSHYLMNELCGESPGLSAAPCAVAYDGLPLPPRARHDDKRESRSTLGLGSDRVIVLLAGQVIERKGVADALNAWSQLPGESRSRADLHIVGDDLESAGRYRREMEQLSADLGVNARFHGFRRDVPDWLVASDIVLVPSHVEPLGNATLEAMAAGRPVIGSDTGGIPEMIVDGSTGLLVPPRDPIALADSIDLLVNKVQLRESLGEAARRRCESTFSIESHVADVVSHYREVTLPVSVTTA